MERVLIKVLEMKRTFYMISIYLPISIYAYVLCCAVLSCSVVPDSLGPLGL